jgi:hypothetical protein
VQGSSSFFLALIFVKKIFWFCTWSFLITIFSSPHVLIAILTRAFALICTISCQQGCICDDCCFFGLLLSSGAFNVSYRVLYLIIIMLYHHIKKNSTCGGGERRPQGIAIKVEKGLEVYSVRYRFII